MKNEEAIKIFVWRFIRVFLATFIAQIGLMQLNWENPKILYTSIISGVIAALAKTLRDELQWNKLPL